MIPKVIHYCWFGRGEKPELARKCIASWKKYCPDYKIIEWNEDNFDVNCCGYVREAYEARQWAFVSDYVRLWALVTYGGIYMDTDIEVVKPLDLFLNNTAFSGFEDNEHCITGVMGSTKGYNSFVQILSLYECMSFNIMNPTTNTTLITSFFSDKGFVPNGQYQVVEGYAIYPADYLCAKNHETGIIHRTKNTHTIHHFNGSWLSDSDKEYFKRKQAAIRRDHLLRTPNRIARRLLGNERYLRIKSMIKKN